MSINADETEAKAEREDIDVDDDDDDDDEMEIEVELVTDADAAQEEYLTERQAILDQHQVRLDYMRARTDRRDALAAEVTALAGLVQPYSYHDSNSPKPFISSSLDHAVDRTLAAILLEMEMLSRDATCDQSDADLEDSNP